MLKTRISDHSLEITYSCVRWFLVVASTYLFLTHYHTTSADLRLFSTLFAVAVTYMGITEIALHRSPITSGFYRFMTRISVIMDYLSFLSVISLTGGTHSLLFPIAYLVILHASLYWSFCGAMVATAMIFIGYVVVVEYVDGGFLKVGFPHHLFNFVFTLMIGVVGGIIVARERKHFVEKGIFENLAKQDYLTGLYNHRSFQEQMREVITSRQAITLIMGDIDFFKQINDRYGHQAGDSVLRTIGSLLNALIPSHEGRAFRYGGEEFAIILYMNNQQKATGVLQNFMERLRAQVFEHGHDLFHVTVSFGAMIRNRDQGKTELVAVADSLLYEAKTQGKDCIRWEHREGTET